MTLICVSLVDRSVKDVASSLDRCRSLGPDLVEIRCDTIQDGPIPKKIVDSVKNSGIQTILTLRPEWEGGFYTGSEIERINALKDLIGFRPHYIDLELNMDRDHLNILLNEAMDHGVRTIVSYHDDKTTPGPTELDRILERFEGIQCDMIKIVLKNDTFEDSVNLLSFSSELKVKGWTYSLMGTGPFGHISRILAPAMECEMVYAGLNGPNIQGQVGIRELKEIWVNAGAGDLH